MGLYLIVIACLYNIVFSFMMMLAPKELPPEKWGDWPYSKSKAALWINEKFGKTKLLGTLRIDRFRYAGVIVSLVIFVASCVILSIDLALGQAIYSFLGDVNTALILLSVILAPILYEDFLAIWWAAANRKSSKISQIKKLKKIQKHDKKK